VILVGALGGVAGVPDAIADRLDFPRLWVIGGHLAAHLGGHRRRRLLAQRGLLIRRKRDVLLLAGDRVDLGFREVGDDADQGNDPADDPPDRQPAAAVSVIVAHCQMVCAEDEFLNVECGAGSRHGSSAVPRATATPPAAT